ncbi:MAG TPA: hypothetical protein VK454_11110 [Myxococcaceae bacterium]|nr:hypothetical protein [Myxococcaceae bacterium]
MKRIRSAIFTAAAAACLGGCFNHDVNVHLDPQTPVEISASGSSGSGSVQVSPGDAGHDYSSNKDKIDSSTLKTLNISISPFPDNVATMLETVVITFSDGSSQAEFQASNIAISAGNQSIPVPSDAAAFLTSVLKSGQTFTATAEVTVDHGPVHVNVYLLMDISLSISLL